MPNLCSCPYFLQKSCKKTKYLFTYNYFRWLWNWKCRGYKILWKIFHNNYYKFYTFKHLVDI